MEKTVKHFCTTAKRIRKDAVEFAKQATMIAGMSAMVVTKMELQRLKEKLPNISIRYTGTWKDSLKFGVGMATTAAGIILALLGGGSEVISAGASTAVSVPAAASGIAIAGTGLAISGSALANMFDVRIQKSESSKGNGSGKSASESGRENVPDKAKEIARQVKENNGAPPKGYKGGRIYKNIPLEEGAQKLPEGVNYREYDINPYVKGQNRGPERIVIGDDNSVWYTNDHYYTFTRIE